MKMNLKTKVVLALLAGGILCMGNALASDTCKWYGTNSSAANQWTTVKANAVASGLTLTLADDTLDTDGHSWKSHDNAHFRAGYSDSSSVTNNKLTILGGEFSEDCQFYAGSSDSYEVSSNHLIIENGKFLENSWLYAGGSGEGNAIGNTITINNGNFEMGEYGGIIGGFSDTNGNVTNNNGLKSIKWTPKVRVLRRTFRMNCIRCFVA